MSVVGFDFGNESCVVAVARQGVIDVVLNNESKRDTPAVVCFGEKQRFIGAAGAASSVMSPKNAVSQIKRLIGRKFSDPELQKDLKVLPFSVTEGADGFPLINVLWKGELKNFTPTQVLGMIFTDLKSIAEKNLGVPVTDCCIGIPVYFTDLQRRAVLDAAIIAGLHPLRMFHETTATALSYGIYKTDLPENEQVNVAFVDVGHSSMQVCIVGYRKGQLKVLAHAFDRSLGGRDFDEVLFQHFAAKFKDEYRIDVLQDTRACIRLRTACEKLKKVLSANPESPLNIECLMDEQDVRGFIKREEFETISIPILERVRGPLQKALSDAGLDIRNIRVVEVVGSGSRVPAIIRILTEFFGKEPRRTMNSSECVASGCALQCAMLSPIYKVREFQIHESFLFPIALSWKGASELPNGAATKNQMTIVFPSGTQVPSTKILTFYRSTTFSVDIVYAGDTDLQAHGKISTYTIGPFQSTNGLPAKLKVKIQLNLHGIVSVESVTMLEEEKVEVPVTPPSEAMKNDEKIELEVQVQSVSEGNGMRADSSGAEIKKEAGDVERMHVDEPMQMKIDAKVGSVEKNVKKVNVPISKLVYGAISATELQKAVKGENEMALQDRMMEETKDKRNALEAYVYDMRNKLYDVYREYIVDSKRDVFLSKLQEVEDWLYGEGEDESRGVYITKLDDLKKISKPIEERYKESLERRTAVEGFVRCINNYKKLAQSSNPRLNHIDIQDKHKVISECELASTWLKEKMQQQDALPKHVNPVLLSADVQKKAEALDRFCRQIMTKHKRPQPQPASPAGTQPRADVSERENTNAGNSTQNASEPMDSDKLE